jgi:uncharacterized Fe-S cluster-containing radical SAM superfamily enzyme
MLLFNPCAHSKHYAQTEHWHFPKLATKSTTADKTLSIISTKIPLNKEQIMAMKKYNLAVQISLDTLCEETAKKMLGVTKEYVSEITKTLNMLEEYGVEYQIATVLTKFNDRTDNLEKIYQFIKNFHKLRRWEIRIAFRSLYSRSDFDLVNISQTSISTI